LRCRYTDKILKGEMAGDLPVELPKKFEPVLNSQDGKTPGITVPPASRLSVTTS
jgi:putative ABC transport system substrate-binding protein